MKKLLTLSLVAIMSISIFAGCKSQEATPEGDLKEDNSLQYILDKGEFVMGLDDAFPPMGYRDENNEIVGFDIDLAQAVCDKLGVELIPQSIDWNANEMELNTKNIDCIWNGMSINPVRSESMCMSAPYLENEMVFVVRNNDGIETIADLAGKKLAVQAGSTAQDALEEATDVKDSLSEVAEYKTNLVALLDLETKGADVVLMDSVVARYQIAQSGKDFIILDEALAPELYGVGFRKEDAALCEAVEQALVELNEDGEVAKIAEKWFGEDITIIGQ